VSFDAEKLNLALRSLPPPQCYWLGFSGGLDSTVLLHAFARQEAGFATRLRVLHVNHHLNPKSDGWQRHCERVCAALHVPIECQSVVVKADRGESLEAVAREQRYKVFRAFVGEGDMLLLAHQQDDQLETFLLQALRGAGLRGLAAMPMVAAFGSGYIARPMLGFSRPELLAWADTHGLSWLDDPSNTDSRFDRNYLRSHVLPLIRQRWPSAATTVARSSAHCGEAVELLTHLAAQDLQLCATDHEQALSVTALQNLGTARAKNLLRHWLEGLRLPLPPTRKLEQVFRDVLPARADRNPCVSWEGAEIRRYRGRVYGLSPLQPAPGGEIMLSRDEPALLGSGMGTLQLSPIAQGERLRAADCPPEGFRVRFRDGGEVCKPVGQAHHRPLKKWLQESKVVPWMRDRLPLLYAGEELAGVAGLFVCAPFAATNGEPGLRVDWLSHPLLQ
jgi:tRNA(Ile)-lysidine synthase